MDTIIGLIVLAIVFGNIANNNKKKQQKQQMQNKKMFDEAGGVVEATPQAADYNEQGLESVQENVLQTIAQIIDGQYEQNPKTKQKSQAQMPIQDAKVEAQMRSEQMQPLSGSMQYQSNEGECDNDHVHSMPLQERTSSMSKLTSETEKKEALQKLHPQAIKEKVEEMVATAGRKKDHVQKGAQAAKSTVDLKNKMEGSSYESHASNAIRFTPAEIKKAVIMAEILKRPKLGVPARRR